jgi:hypothetical protein
MMIPIRIPPPETEYIDKWAIKGVMSTFVRNFWWMYWSRTSVTGTNTALLWQMASKWL